MKENTEKLSYVKINLYEIKILLALTRSTQKRNKIVTQRRNQQNKMFSAGV